MSVIYKFPSPVRSSATPPTPPDEVQSASAAPITAQDLANAASANSKQTTPHRPATSSTLGLPHRLRPGTGQLLTRLPHNPFFIQASPNSPSSA